MSVPRRETGRHAFQRRTGIVSSAEIEAAVKASGIKDDNDKTGPMGIRDSSAQRKTAAEIRDSRKKK